jgi:hypothetical protein
MRGLAAVASAYRHGAGGFLEKARGADAALALVREHLGPLGPCSPRDGRQRWCTGCNNGGTLLLCAGRGC